MADKPTERWNQATIHLYRDLLFDQQGRCFVCEIEEWRIKRPLQVHRIIPGKKGGRYTKDNCVAVYTACHKKCEGKTREQLIAMRDANRSKRP